jgi:hypothetical protein
MIRLKKTGEGYESQDGRFTVKPVTIGEGINNNRQWSKGHREWQVTDTTGQARLGIGGPTIVVHALYAARDLIEGVQNREAQ